MDDDFDEGGNEDDEVMSEPATEPFVVPKSFSKGTDVNGGPNVIGKWSRVSLFDSSRGEIGLAWSIFRVRGTPDQTNWPVSFSLFKILRLKVALFFTSCSRLKPFPTPKVHRSGKLLASTLRRDCLICRRAECSQQTR